MTDNDIAASLFACTLAMGNSEQRRLHMIDLPQLILPLAAELATGRYRPQAFTVFAVTDPKLREIFAPSFRDRLAQHWVVGQVEPHIDKIFIDDSFANRKGRGTHAAIDRLAHFMRQPGHSFYCQMDVQSFFPSIDRRILQQLWQLHLKRLPLSTHTRWQLDQVVRAILAQNPLQPAPRLSGDRRLLAQIPTHKSLFHTQAGKGLPIGALTSQFFSNVFLHPLDHYIKHELKIKGYVRYVDDLIILGPSTATLKMQQQAIADFLQRTLALRLHPHKTVLQPIAHGADFLGAIVYPHHRLARQRVVRALRARLDFFKQITQSTTNTINTSQMINTAARFRNLPASGRWASCVSGSQGLLPEPGEEPSAELLQRMMATINSYFGHFRQANTVQLRKHIYHHELGILERFFLPGDKDYSHIRIRTHWLLISDL